MASPRWSNASLGATLPQRSGKVSNKVLLGLVVEQISINTIVCNKNGNNYRI